MIILLTGPAGSGKTTLASRIARHADWIHVGEDDLRNEIGHPPESPPNRERQDLRESRNEL